MALMWAAKPQAPADKNLLLLVFSGTRRKSPFIHQEFKASKGTLEVLLPFSSSLLKVLRQILLFPFKRTSVALQSNLNRWGSASLHSLLSQKEVTKEGDPAHAFNFTSWSYTHSFCSHAHSCSHATFSCSTLLFSCVAVAFSRRQCMNYSKIKQLEYKWRRNSALERYVLFFLNMHLHINPISTGQNQSDLWHFDHKNIPLEQRFLEGEHTSGDYICTDALLPWCPHHPRSSNLSCSCTKSPNWSKRLQCSSFPGFHCMQPDHLQECMGNTRSNIHSLWRLWLTSPASLLSAFPCAHHLISHLQKLTAA